MVSIKHFKCPSCGAALELNIPNQVMTVCPYCHQQVFYTEDLDESPSLFMENFNCDDDINKYGIPFKDSDDEFREKIIHKIVDDNGTPLDIFAKAKILNAKKMYVPMYRYTGNFQGTWTLEIMYYKKAQRMDPWGRLEDGVEETPQYVSGNSSGRFVSISSAVNLDYFNNRINFDLDIDRIMDSLGSEVVPLEDGIEVYSCDYTPDSAWRIDGERRAGSNAAFHTGKEQKGFVKGYSWDYSDIKTSIIYFPCRMIEFDYEGKRYKCIEVLNKIDFDYPISEECSSDTEEKKQYSDYHSDDDNGCLIIIALFAAYILLGVFLSSIFEWFGVEKKVASERAQIVIWLLFFLIFLLYRIGDTNIDTSSKKYLERKNYVDLEDCVVIIFLSIGVTYAGSCINDYIGITKNDEYLCFAYFVLSCYVFNKIRKSEIRKYDMKVEMHNKKLDEEKERHRIEINNLLASYRRKKLDDSAFFNWIWNADTFEGNIQTHKESTGGNVVFGKDQKCEVILCRHCGKELRSGYKFCSYCGMKQ